MLLDTCTIVQLWFNLVVLLLQFLGSNGWCTVYVHLSDV